MQKYREKQLAYNLDHQSEIQQADQAAPTDPHDTTALKEKYRDTVQSHLSTYQEISDILRALEQQGEHFSSGLQQEISEFRDSLAKIEEQRPYLLEGQDPESGKTEFSDIKTLAKYAHDDYICEQKVNNLLEAKADKILPLVNDMNHLSLLSKITKDHIANTSKTVEHDSLHLVQSMATTRAALRMETKDALAESQVQADIINLLGTAIESFDQPKIDHKKHGFRHWLKKEANHLGMHFKTPEQYGEKMANHIKSETGLLLDAEMDKKSLLLHITQKNGAVGAQPSEGFLLNLQDTYDSIDNKYEKLAFSEAIDASEHIQWTTNIDGKKTLSYTPSALKKLEEAHATPGVSAQDKLQMGLSNAVDDMKLIPLKKSLITSFQPQVDQLQQKASHPFHLENHIAQGKAEITSNLMNDLMLSTDAQSMQEKIVLAAQIHNELCQNSLTAKNGGTTAILLDDMYKAVSRYRSISD
ncbi:hypothetical protein [Vibrio mangrovi]|nr:hypothetical protein [Vibrio mangrovi]